MRSQPNCFDVVLMLLLLLLLFLLLLLSLFLLPVYLCPDVDDSTAVFTQIFKSVLDKHAPWIVFQHRKRFVPWLTEETEKMMKTRNELKWEAIKKVKEGEDSSHVWAEFKKLRNEINNRRKFEEKAFKKEQMSKSLHCPKETWKTAKKFMEWDRNGGPPSQLSLNGELVTKAFKIATEMNNFFIQKVRLIRNGISHIPNRLTKCLEIMESKSCKLSMKHVSVSKVNRLLKTLKNSKSTSIDELDNFCVKIAADVIAEPLHHIITQSILQQKFPTLWKFSKVIPLHKKDSKLERKNYRPVAILSPLSKVLERIVYEDLYHYFTNNKLFHSNLHGYRQYRSTQTALLSMYDRWVRNAARGQVSGVVLLDLSAAFDLVEPSLLLSKLRIYGVDENYLCWIQSYLSNRFQAVWIDHVLSDFLHCDVGVPQGSNLGPLFFSIFFNDLPDSLSCEVDNYADDTTLTSTGASVAEIGQKLTENCHTVSTWMKANKLKLNPDKTHILTMGTQERLANLEHSLQVSMDNVQLQEDEGGVELLLGCHVQANLKWRCQISALESRLKRRLAGLQNLKNILSFAMRKTITEGVFNSVLVYCLPLYGGADTGQVKSVQVLQNKASQIVCHAPPRASRAPMYDRLGWLSVNQLISYHTLISVYKIKKFGEPEYLASHLNKENIYGRIIIPNCGLGLATKSFSYRGARQWNLLPASIRRATKISIFKKELRRWIQANVPRFLD